MLAVQNSILDNCDICRYRIPTAVQHSTMIVQPAVASMVSERVIRSIQVLPSVTVHLAVSIHHVRRHSTAHACKGVPHI